MQLQSRTPIGRALLSLGMIGGFVLFLAFLNVSTSAAAPETKYRRTLHAGDRLVIAAQACQLQIRSQSASLVVVRCAASNARAEKINAPRAKSKLVLHNRDRVRITANGCALQIASARATRVVVKCPGSAPTDWLGFVNAYRALADLPAVTENATWSQGDWLHARYMVKNDYIGHDEDPSNPWYTVEGRAAAQNSDLAVSSSAAMSDQTAIELWMGAPFHAVGIIDPALAQVGYGSYRESDGGYQTGAGLDVLRGLGSIPPAVTYPVKWPGSGKTVALRSYDGGEYPNPLASCAGYTVPSGLPLILQIGDGSLTPNVTAHSFKQGAAELEHCIYDETHYTNPDISQQNLVRSILNARDAIVLIPRAPLTAGNTYTASLTTNGNTYAWSFTIASSARDLLLSDAEMR